MPDGQLMSNCVGRLNGAANITPLVSCRGLAVCSRDQSHPTSPMTPRHGQAAALLPCSHAWLLSLYAMGAGGQQPCAHGQGRLEGPHLSTRDELVSVPTQSCPRTTPEQVYYAWWSPLPELPHAAGPLHTLLALQGESYVRVGELVDDPEMQCVFEEHACPCQIFSV